MRSMLQNDLGSYVQDAISAGAASSAAGLQKVLEIQRDWILNKAAGISENFDYSYGMFGIHFRITFSTPPHTSLLFDLVLG
jgi:ribosomal protein L6P/L9E